MSSAKQNIKNPLLLLLTAAIWGVAFVAQSVGAEYIGAFTFNCIRFLLGGMVLFPLIVLLEKREYAHMADHTKRFQPVTKIELKGGILCGIFIFAASNIQQIGIKYTSVGRAGFITALYVVLVPILGLFLKKKVAPLIWVCVSLALVGLYLLCMGNETGGPGFGDGLMIISAVIFAFHILAIDYFSPRGRGTVISCIQFLVGGGASLIVALIVEHPQLAGIRDAGVSLLYAGILSCGVAYTLQIVAQKGVNPAVASLILCLESVISVLAGWVILGETLSPRELAGCGLMFLAIVIAQVSPAIKRSPVRKKRAALSGNEKTVTDFGKDPGASATKA